MKESPSPISTSPSATVVKTVKPPPLREDSHDSNVRLLKETLPFYPTLAWTAPPFPLSVEQLLKWMFVSDISPSETVSSKTQPSPVSRLIWDTVVDEAESFPPEREIRDSDFNVV